MQLETLIWLIPIPPVVAFVLIILGSYRSNRLSHSIAVGGMFVSWLMAMIVFANAIGMQDLGHHPIAASIEWLPFAETPISLGVFIDPLGAVTLFFVAWTCLAIFIYSIGYHNFGKDRDADDVPGLPPKAGGIEPMYARFFAFISLFAFAMLLLVVADNLLLLFISWEIMGLCSYLLIGFWFGRDSARKAMVKAFITTRVGDVLMLLGLAYLHSLTGTLSYREIFFDEAIMQQLATTPAVIGGGLSAAGLIGILLFFGTVGKSAQWPLHVWLPDAMEGPTPVSAMIHAATMVSAGVYLALRSFPLLTAGWHPGEPLTAAMQLVAFIGAFTAFFAATIALAQNDIKRVLAYSTISQLGFMVAAIGIGAYVAAAFHLVTHAFFKGLLFLGSGSVIHGMEHGMHATHEHVDPQDMLNMGGLRKVMPVTFWTFLIGGLALSGFPLVTAGFWSKDEIFAEAFANGNWTVLTVLALAALMTAFYTMRQITLTFLGKPRTAAAKHAHESVWTMTLPLVMLAVFAVGLGWVGIPEDFPLLGGILPNWFHHFIAGSLPVHFEGVIFSWGPLLISILVAGTGLLTGWLVYRKQAAGVPDPLVRTLGSVYTVLKNKYYFDELYQKVFIGPAYWFAQKVVYEFLDRRVIDGILHGFAAAMMIIGDFLRDRFDVPIINGLADRFGEGVKQGGETGRKMQTGRVQTYLIAGLLLAGILLSYVVVFEPAVR